MVIAVEETMPPSSAVIISPWRVPSRRIATYAAKPIPAISTTIHQVV